MRNLTSAALSRYLSTVEAARAFRLSLIRDVALAYLALIEADERVALADATLESRVKGLGIAKRRVDSGVTSELDFHQAESLLTQAQSELAAQHLAKAQAANFLARLIGGPPQAPLPNGLPLAQQSPQCRSPRACHRSC